MLHSGRLQPYSQTLRLGWTGLKGTNTLAYYEHPLITNVKSFITTGPRRNIESYLKSLDPIKYELNGYSKKPVEVVLSEILSVQTSKDYNKNQIAV